MPQVIVIPFDDQEIGQGYNSETRESLGTALTVASMGEDPNADGQEVITTFESVTTQEDLMRSLGIDVSADASFGLFSGGAKFSFAEQNAVNSYSSYIAGRCAVQNATRHGQGFQLTADAKALTDTGQMDQFKTAFGDMFVRSLKTGGEIIVIVRITSVSEEHQTKIAASLHAEYDGLVAGGTFDSAFTDAMTQTKNQTEVKVYVDQKGGIGGQAAYSGPEAAAIIQRLKEFPQIVHDHATGYEVELAAYDTIPLPIPTPEERADRQLVLQDCLNQKLGFLKGISDLDLMMSENGPQFFDGLPPAATLETMQGQYRAALNGLMAHAIQVSTGRMDPPALYVANPPPPPLNFTKKQLASTGAAPGDVILHSVVGKWKFEPMTFKPS